MAISSSSGSNSFGDYSSSSSSSPSSSSSLSASSIDSIPESREPTPEWDPTTAYEALAPLHWDSEEFDFGVASEEDEPTTERKTFSSYSKRNWRAAKTTPSPGKESTPLKRSAPLPVTTRRQEETPTNSSKLPWRGANKEVAAAADKAAAAATMTTMMTTVETHRREARYAVGIQIPTTGRCR